MSLCPKCGTSNADHAVFCQSCGNTLQLPTTVAPAEPYGGFWKRVLAWLIDAIVLSAVTGTIAAVTLGAGFFLFFVAHWLYEAFLTSSSWQATLGKRALNMVVTDLDGQRLSFAHATGRHFSKWISAMALGIGFILVAFSRKKQGLHDMIASTRVMQR
jgi:uncharacterized RDD family membrane protein YckC